MLEGSYTISNSLDVEFLQGYTEITGNLAVEALGLTSFDLSALSSVDAGFYIFNNNNLAQCLIDALMAQIQAGEGIGGEIWFCLFEWGEGCAGTTNHTDCTCSEVDGVLVADCP